MPAAWAGLFPFLHRHPAFLLIGTGLTSKDGWLQQTSEAGAHLPSLRGLLLILAAVICFALTIGAFRPVLLPP